MCFRLRIPRNVTIADQIMRWLDGAAGQGAFSAIPNIRE
jgi:hypothetical protein